MNMKLTLLAASIGMLVVAGAGLADPITVGANCGAALTAGANALLKVQTEPFPTLVDILAEPGTLLDAVQNLVGAISSCVTIG